MISVTDPESGLRSESIKEFSNHVVAYKHFSESMLATIFDDESCICIDNKNIIPFDHFTDFLHDMLGIPRDKDQDDQENNFLQLIAENN